MTRRLKHFHSDLSTGEAAYFCGVHAQTIINWCDMGRLKWNRIDNGPRRIPVSEVVELLLRNKMDISPELLENGISQNGISQELLDRVKKAQAALAA